MAKKAAKKKKKPTRGIAPERKLTLAQRIEEAMAMAIKVAYAEGITDPVDIKIRIQAARDKIASE